MINLKAFTTLKALQRASLVLIGVFLFSGCQDGFFSEKKPDYNPGGILNKKTVGSSARDLLSAEAYNHMVVEIQYAQGFEPTQAAVNNLLAFLNKHVNKPKGITVKRTSIPAPGNRSYTVQQLAAIEDKYRTAYTRPDTMGVYFFFADSGFSEDTDNSKVLGIAYRNTSMVIFERTVQQYSGGFSQPERSKLETVIMNHEFGHILGLVNAGTPMQEHHQDTQNGRHCTDRNCLMNWVVETGNVVQNLFGGAMPELDQKCINDLKANGGK